jgi:hypothetical protein
MENTKRSLGLRAFAGVLAATLIIVGVLWSGVNLPTSENNPHLGTQQGTLTVLLIDAPVELDQLTVNITQLEVHRVGEDDSEGEWILLWEDEQGIIFDLLDLQDGNSLQLASGELEAGNFSKIRMFVSEANATYINDPIPIPLKVPSEKIDVIVKFEIKEGENVIVIIDMEADWIAISNRMTFRPVLKATVTKDPYPDQGE